MNEFVYLYRRPPRPTESPRQLQARMDKYYAWFRDLEAKGHLASFGQPLEDRAGCVVKDRLGSVSDGPYAETKDIVVGFSIITAKSLDEAAALAKTCPIFDEGGMIELRPILEL